MDIVDTLLASCGTQVMQVQNSDIMLNFKGNTRLVNDGSATEEYAHFGITARNSNNYIIYCNQTSCDLVMTFYDTATIKPGTGNGYLIYYTSSKPRYDVRFHESYTGNFVAAARPNDGGAEQIYLHESLQSALNQYRKGIIYLAPNIEFADTVSLTWNPTFVSPYKDDASAYPNTPTTVNFTYTGTGAAFKVVGAISVTFPNATIVSSNIAFDFGNDAGANASVIFNDITLHAATYTTGMNDGDSIAPLLAKIGTLHYATLQDAIDNAVANDTITLVGNVTLEDSIIINKNLTIDGAGYTITSNNAPAFMINSGCKLALNNVNMVGTVLTGFVSGNVTTNSATLAAQLAEKENWVMSDPIEGVYTVTGKYVAVFNGTKYTFGQPPPISKTLFASILFSRAENNALADSQTQGLVKSRPQFLSA
jgi:hypothetical protein